MLPDKIAVPAGALFWTCYRNGGYRDSAWDGQPNLCTPWQGRVWKEQRQGGVYHELQILPEASEAEDRPHQSWMRHVSFNVFKSSMERLLFQTLEEAQAAYVRGLRIKGADAEESLDEAERDLYAYLVAHPEFCDPGREGKARLTLTLNCGHEGLQGREELSQVLRVVAYKLRADGLQEGELQLIQGTTFGQLRIDRVVLARRAREVHE